jgi:phage terminase large subunit-like protein
VAWFAEHVLGTPLDPWERLAVIHGGELLPDGRPRFRKLLIVVARQQGKTLLCRVLTLFWLFVEGWPMVLGTSTNLAYAKESWNSVVQYAENTPDLAERVGKDGVRKAAGEECLTTIDGCRYRIAASNRKGGRSLSVDRLILDELREHVDWSAWGAAYPTLNARPYGQVVAITNMGDDTSVVLNSLRAEAVAYIESGEGDERLGLLEWSAPEDSDPEDPEALAYANPNLGGRTDLADLLADARRAKRNGGEELATFKTEIMCMRVKMMNPAIDPGAWGRCLLPGGLDAVRGRVALAVDVSPTQRHATAYAAAVLPDGKVRVDFVKAWEGQGCADQMRKDLPVLLARVKPKAFGWLPSGPAAAVAADLGKRKRRGWPPPGCAVEEIRGELSAVCMGFESLVAAGQVAHSNDPLLNAHVGAAERLKRADAWVFSRKGDGDVDAAYAAAAAVHLARTLPPSLGKLRLLTAE